MKTFDIPVALFIFKRQKAVDVISRIREVRPKKIYLLADEGRNPQEKEAVQECRKKVEEAIDWDCEVIKNYAQENRGVYENIGEGAKWVLRREKWAIFLEDDNLPEVSFFEFCREMLHRYEEDTRILWVCGTNYLGQYQSPHGESYMFTRHMLPCGWASWANKFEKFYDGHMELVKNPAVVERIGNTYCNRSVYRQYRKQWMLEAERMAAGCRPSSWDYQMDFSIKANNLFGICPCNNQIRNIGVDEHSIHGGSSANAIMTKRFCGMGSYPLSFPLKHPATVLPDKEFERKIGKIILIPFRVRAASGIRGCLVKTIKFLFQIPKDQRTGDFFKKVLKKQ